MQDNSEKIVILLADDDPDDREMTRKALARNRLANKFYAVADGEELMDFLRHQGRFAPPALSPTPGLILLDLNMPKKDEIGSTRLNSSHLVISYAVFCLKKKI